MGCGVSENEKREKQEDREDGKNHGGVLKGGVEEGEGRGPRPT